MIVGAVIAGNNSRVFSGSSYVIWGERRRTSTLQASARARALQIDGAAAGDQSGYSVAGASNVNGDGEDDVIVSTRDARNNSRTNSGSSYVIYGSASPTNVDLASLSSTRVFESTAPRRMTPAACRSAAPATSTATARTT